MLLSSIWKRPALIVAFGLIAAIPANTSLVSAAGPFDLASAAKGILGNASDNALNKLSQPGAFYADTAVRIILPGAGGKLASNILKFGDKAGLTSDLSKSINDAAGLAANEAKPIFRAAVDNIKLNDVPDLATKSDGATQYLKKSAGGELRNKVRPLVVAALTKVGAFGKLEKLGKAGSVLGKLGVSSDGLTDSVTDQTLNGIYNYMGAEEANLRKDPLKTGKSIIDILKKK